MGKKSWYFEPMIGCQKVVSWSCYPQGVFWNNYKTFSDQEVKRTPIANNHSRVQIYIDVIHLQVSLEYHNNWWWWKKNNRISRRPICIPWWNESSIREILNGYPCGAYHRRNNVISSIRKVLDQAQSKWPLEMDKFFLIIKTWINQFFFINPYFNPISD